MIFLTHGHSDHVGDSVEIAKKTGAKLFAQLDLALHKSLPLWTDSSKLDFRAEAFNVLNATNFEYPDGSITDGASFGAYSSAVVYPSRQVQLALRLSF